MEGYISHKDYVELRMRYSNGGNYGHFSADLKRKLSKVNLSTFDRSRSISSQAWLMKADIYFQLNPTPEQEASKFTALHLEGVVHEWWHHSMATLNHYQVNTYAEFTKRLIDNFDGNDPELKNLHN